jgi:hypothetical protein
MFATRHIIHPISFIDPLFPCIVEKVVDLDNIKRTLEILYNVPAASSAFCRKSLLAMRHSHFPLQCPRDRIRHQSSKAGGITYVFLVSHVVDYRFSSGSFSTVHDIEKPGGKMLSWSLKDLDWAGRGAVGSSSLLEFEGWIFA